ncbi:MULTISPECIES: hypothetical protein [Deefgea]|uniref:Uncharacterized protein n=1 Tax=Deefgea chitinilytica TaxID=570276 RepID=A0ABS2CFN0_9NEIS|nr:MULTISPECIES: hypothetical protein [Deefgea]MBM5572942.1 hypothetical protein [Deefgea chitinilytica]MBM9890178.1 hypothetical protein [Deefgea sp. CFH1-16]
MSFQYNGIPLYTLAQVQGYQPQLHARILQVAGEWLVLFGNKIAFTDDADLVGILHEANLFSPQVFASKREAADFLDQYTSSFASVSC